jgi:allantoin racemase
MTLIRIWHQSFTDLDVFPRYRETLQVHAEAASDSGSSVSVHGLRPGTYPAGTTPMEVNSRAGLRLSNARQVCEAALTAEAAGYDAFALGCFFDPALDEARSLVSIPVVSLTETCMLTACSLGRRFAVVALTDFQKMLSEDLAVKYGIASRLAGVVTMSPPVSLFDLEGDGPAVAAIISNFTDACERAVSLGAEVIIPGDGVLNEFLFRHHVRSVGGAVVLDGLGILFQHAAFFARARIAGSLDVSRSLLYAKPTPAMSLHAGMVARREEDFSGWPGHGRLTGAAKDARPGGV